MHTRLAHRLLLAAFLLLAGTALDAAAQAYRPDAPAPQGRPVRPDVLDEIGVDEQLDGALPLDLEFRNETGAAVRLDDFFDGERPVLLNLVYHDCPMLCNVFLDKLTQTMRTMAWVPGQEFEVLTVSFNAIETPELAARQKARYVAALGKPEAAAGWHFLTGDSTAIGALTEAVGFRYAWVEDQQEFAHPATLIFLSGDGRVMRYLYGFDVSAGDVRAALVEASEGKVGTALDQFVLLCFQYDPLANSYVPHALTFMKIGGGLAALALLAVLVFFWRRERSPGRRPTPDMLLAET